MMSSDEVERIRKRYCIPVYLQKLRYQERYGADLDELSSRATQLHPEGITVLLPWIRWEEIAGYLGCVEYARNMIRDLPTGHSLTLEQETPAQYHTVGVVLFSQALADNLAVWLAEQLPLGISGGDQNFLKKPFRKEFTKKLKGSATDFLARHDDYLNELNEYRQTWIHRHAGGGVLVSTEAPDDPSAQKSVGVPIDPAFSHHYGDAQQRAERIARTNGGRYLYEAAEFADRIANGGIELFFDVLRLSFAHVK